VRGGVEGEGARRVMGLCVGVGGQRQAAGGGQIGAVLGGSVIVGKGAVRSDHGQPASRPASQPAKRGGVGGVTSRGTARSRQSGLRSSTRAWRKAKTPGSPHFAAVNLRRLGWLPQAR
jgi:hypothetical protein